MSRQSWGCKVETVSTQVIPRDRHAAYFAALAVVASSLERLATEVRHLQRTEVLEAQEFFAEGQKGSSAMPHKRNPILSENIVGLARVVRSYAMPAFENVALWHERDMSHSSVERFIAPDATITLDFALVRMAGVIDKLLIRADRMKKNLDLDARHRPFAARAAGADAGRDRARGGLQARAERTRCAPGTGEGTLLDLLKADPEVSKAVPAKTLEAMFDNDYHTKQVDTIFKRVFG